MARASAGPKQDWNNIVEDESEVLGQGRRRLLGGATGGLIVAAGGLLLPNWLAEAEAREGALGGAHGGRRGKNQRGRHKKRTHGDEKARPKENDKPRGLGPKGIRLMVVNETDHDFNLCSFWVGSVGWGREKWKNLGRRTSRTSYFTEETENFHAGMLFPGEREPFIWLENPHFGTPNTTYQYGGSMSPFGYRGGTVDVAHGTLDEGAETTHRIPFTDSSVFAIKVQRKEDFPRFKEFTMTILPD